MTSLNTLHLEYVVSQLKDFIHPDYHWPDIPKGWQLEFIVYPDGEVNMDFLHPITCCFWSDDHDFLDVPTLINNERFSAQVLKRAGIPYITTFSQAAISDTQK